MLMIADRVDVLEHNVPRAAWLLGGLGAAALVWLALRPDARRDLPRRARYLAARASRNAGRVTAQARQRFQHAT
jgi:hypothetical protein